MIEIEQFHSKQFKYNQNFKHIPYTLTITSEDDLESGTIFQKGYVEYLL